MIQVYSEPSAKIRQIQIEHLRQMPVWRKLALVAEMTKTVQILAMAGLHQRYPNETQEQLRRRLASLMLGDDLAAKAYGLLTGIENAG
jgi:hypothetical protein